LEKGDPIGFSRDASGRLSAVVRGKHSELKPGAYAWTMQPDSGQIDPAATALLVVAVVVVVGVGIGVAAAATSSGAWLNVGALGGG
jgi:hypothetical protein